MSVVVAERRNRMLDVVVLLLISCEWWWMRGFVGRAAGVSRQGRPVGGIGRHRSLNSSRLGVRSGELAHFWIGHPLLDRLISYPDRNNLSRSSQPIQNISPRGPGLCQTWWMGC